MLFGLLHLNPWQFIAAFNLGLLAGWVFYRTKSIIPAIAVHFVNNGSASLLSYLEEGETEYNIPPLEVYGSATQTLTVVAVAALLVWLCVVLLDRTLPAPGLALKKNDGYDNATFDIIEDEAENNSNTET